MNRTVKKALLMLFLFLGQYCVAQTESVFKLTQEHGHFYCETTLNGANAKLMLESGIPGLMMSETFYEAHKDSLKMEVKESNEKIRFLSGMRHVKYTAQARLRMGDAIFEGPVKIISDDNELKIPIQMLHHLQDNSSIVMINLAKSQFCVCSRDALQKLTKDASAWNLTNNQFGMPVVTTSLTISADGHQKTITGNFITDMGNASLLFLNKCNTSVEKLFSDGKISLKDAHDKRTGKVIAQGVYAEELTICKRTFEGVSVGVSTFKSLEECGFLGLKFFTMPSIFDFDENKMYLCK